MGKEKIIQIISTNSGIVVALTDVGRVIMTKVPISSSAIEWDEVALPDGVAVGSALNMKMTS